MRKLTVSTMVSLDGVMEAPGAMELADSRITSKGVIINLYRPAGVLKMRAKVK